MHHSAKMTPLWGAATVLNYLLLVTNGSKAWWLEQHHFLLSHNLWVRNSDQTSWVTLLLHRALTGSPDVGSPVSGLPWSA